MAEPAHSESKLNSLNLQQALDDINLRLKNLEQTTSSRLANIEQAMKVHQARAANIRILNRNRLYWNDRGLLDPLQKWVEGSGRDLAVQAAATLGSQVQIALNAIAPPNPNGTAAAAVVGSTPPNFDRPVFAFEDVDVLRMIVFYNEDFGIVPQDSLGDRIGKFRRFLTEF